jgi:hypothetical protein
MLLTVPQHKACWQVSLGFYIVHPLRQLFLPEHSRTSQKRKRIPFASPTPVTPESIGHISNETLTGVKRSALLALAGSLEERAASVQYD